jgi:hypothetical protein
MVAKGRKITNLPLVFENGGYGIIFVLFWANFIMAHFSG